MYSLSEGGINVVLGNEISTTTTREDGSPPLSPLPLTTSHISVLRGHAPQQRCLTTLQSPSTRCYPLVTSLNGQGFKRLITSTQQSRSIITRPWYSHSTTLLKYPKPRKGWIRSVVVTDAQKAARPPRVQDRIRSRRLCQVKSCCDLLTSLAEMTRNTIERSTPQWHLSRRLWGSFVPEGENIN